MTDASYPTSPLQFSRETSDVRQGQFDTTAGSVPHHLYRRLNQALLMNRFTRTKLYVASVLITLVPLLIAAGFSPPVEMLRLQFLQDWNVLFMFAVTFPCLVILIVCDQPILDQALQIVRTDGTIEISKEKERELADKWYRNFRITNLVAQTIGLIVGAIITYANYVIYVPADVGYWIASNGSLLPVGYLFFYCTFLFFALVPLYVLRNVVLAFLLGDIVAHGELHMLPLHPDGAGGLRPVGWLGLRNQYGLTLCAINILLLVAVSELNLDISKPLSYLIAAAVIAYVLLGPMVFMAPLLAFRTGMLKIKGQLMGEVARRIRFELDRLRGQIPSGTISSDDEALIDRLRKIGSVIDELPVWPFDTGTLRKFLAAYIIPPLLGAVPILVGAIFPDVVDVFMDIFSFAGSASPP